MEIKSVLEILCNSRGTSGDENRVAQEVLTLFAPYTDETYTDPLGSVICIKCCGRPNAKKVMLDAHMDEIGLMVTEVDDKGFLRFTKIGGVDERILPGGEVMVHGKRDILGIIGLKPPHLQSGDEHKKTIKIEDLAIDLGLDAAMAKESVCVGDSITFQASVCSLGAEQVCAKSLDDRAGVAALLLAADKLFGAELAVDVYFVISVQEEVGLRGAKTAAYSVNPDYALAIDVTHGITPDNSERAFAVGKGPTTSGGPNIHPALFKLMKQIAKEKDIALHPEIDGGSTGTNAWAIQTSREGVPTAVLSIPLKYMHTPVEVLSVSDLEKVGTLTAEFVFEISRREADEQWLWNN